MSSSSTMSDSASISAQGLLKLLKHTGKSAVLRVKTTNSIMRTVKWEQRFVILANNELYIYKNEMSQKATACIPLLVYNQVKRFNSNKYPWCFSIVPAVSSVKAKVFSSPTETERKEWMRTIKDHMYKAKNVQRPFTDDLNELARGTEEEYIDLEEPIISPDDTKSEKDFEDFSDPESNNSNIPDDDDDASDIDDLESFRRSSNRRKFSSSSSQADRELPPIPGEQNPLPPRYSDLVEDKHTYQNQPLEEDDVEVEAAKKALGKSKMEACLISDPDLERNREGCRALLMSKSLIGLYLIRKSRQGDNYVLAVLTENSDVKEYRLEEKENLYRLSNKAGDADFISMEALLEFYSSTAFLPGLNHYITFGIFEYDDEVYQEMQ